MPSKSTLACAAAFAIVALAATTTEAWAWGAKGHRLIGRVAMQALPADVPDFLRTPEAVDFVGELAREPDRSKGGGQPHDADLEPWHFVDLTEDGHVFQPNGPTIDALPRSRTDYDVVLAHAGIDPYKGGSLPYSMVDGYQQLVKDFSYWRGEKAILTRNLLPAHRGWLEMDVKLREALVVRDLGWWAHFVGDGSQPMHVSIHYNGWGDYPNPEGFTQDKIHGPFEGAFVAANVGEADVRAALPAPTDCGPSILVCTTTFLKATEAETAPLYRLWKTGAFTGGGDKAAAKAFTVKRVAAGAAMLRDLTVRAWRESAHGSFGRHNIKVEDYTGTGAPLPAEKLWEEVYGDD